MRVSVPSLLLLVFPFLSGAPSALRVVCLFCPRLHQLLCACCVPTREPLACGFFLLALRFLFFFGRWGSCRAPSLSPPSRCRWPCSYERLVACVQCVCLPCRVAFLLVWHVPCGSSPPTFGRASFSCLPFHGAYAGIHLLPPWCFALPTFLCLSSCPLLSVCRRPCLRPLLPSPFHVFRFLFALSSVLNNKTYPIL